MGMACAICAMVLSILYTLEILKVVCGLAPYRSILSYCRNLAQVDMRKVVRKLCPQLSLYKVSKYMCDPLLHCAYLLSWINRGDWPPSSIYFPWLLETWLTSL